MESLKSFPLRGEFEVSWLTISFNKINRDFYLISKLRMTECNRPAICFKSSSNLLEIGLKCSLCVVNILIGSVEARIKSVLRLRDLFITAWDSLPDNHIFELPKCFDVF